MSRSSTLHIKPTFRKFFTSYTCLQTTSLYVKLGGTSEIIHLLALSRVSDLHTIKKPILKIGPF